MSGRAERIRRQAMELGFSMAGIAEPEVEHVGFYEEWLRQGLHGEMTYLARPDAVERRGDLHRTLEGVRSVLVVAHEYFQEDSAAGEAPSEGEAGASPLSHADRAAGSGRGTDVFPTADPSRGIIARYARGADYHRVVKKKLLALARWMELEIAPDLEARAYVDTGPILERELGRRAGLGWFGRNTMLIHPRRGSFFFLGALLTDLELEPSPPFEADHCGTCKACLDACPTGALLGRNEDGAPLMDARRCISYLTIEHRGPIPTRLRPLIGNRIYGCDICQEVCPFNERFAQAAAEPRYAARGPGELPYGVEAVPGEGAVEMEAPRGERPSSSVETGGMGHPPHPGTDAPSLVELMRMTREQWDAFSRGSAIRRVGYAGFKRNVAVAMGNWLAAVEDPPGDAVAALRGGLEDESRLIREHAAWALARLGVR